jgi:hypothetical protein
MNLYPDNLDFTQMGETVDMHGTQYVAFSQAVWEQIDKTIRELHATCENETKWAKHYMDALESERKRLDWLDRQISVEETKALFKRDDIYTGDIRAAIDTVISPTANTGYEPRDCGEKLKP